jgi:hypothetical protein
MLSLARYLPVEPGRLADWRPGSRRLRILVSAFLVLFAIHAATYFALIARRAAAEPIGDFFGLWSAGRFISEHPAAQVYDPALLHAAQLAMGMEPHLNFPFPYPPSFLLALWPLAQLPYWTAYALAIGVTLTLYASATIGRGWRSAAFAAALLAPTTTMTIVAGQSGFLEAALLAGGFRLAGARPILAGILLGLLTYKPQIGILVPVALIAARAWRVIAAACATFIILVAATSLAFGATIWLAWLSQLEAYSDQFAAEAGHIGRLMPTILQSLSALGAAPGIAQTGQVIAALASAGVVWRCFRMGPPQLAAAALFVAAFLATPHAFVYDMPVVATAVLWFAAERQRSGDAFSVTEILVMVLAMIAPTLLPAGNAIPVATLSLILLLAAIFGRVQRLRSPPAAIPEPLPQDSL